MAVNFEREAMKELKAHTRLLERISSVLEAMAQTELLNQQANEALLKGLFETDPKIERNVAAQEDQMNRMLAAMHDGWKNHALDE